MELIMNRSYTYILPMLDWLDSKVLVNSQLRGVFIGDVSYPALDKHIFLLYRFSGERWFSRFEAALQESKYFITTYDPSKQHVMFVFEVSSKYRRSYDMFRQSKYSEMDEVLKTRVVEFHGEENTKRIVAVMYKHESMFKEWEKGLNEGLPRDMHIRIPRDQEAADVLHMNVEMYSDELESGEIESRKGSIKLLKRGEGE